MSTIKQSTIENQELYLMDRLAHAGGWGAGAKEVLTLVEWSALARKQSNDVPEGVGKTAVSQMLTSFAQNALVRDEPSIFGVPPGQQLQ